MAGNDVTDIRDDETRGDISFRLCLDTFMSLPMDDVSVGLDISLNASLCSLLVFQRLRFIFIGCTIDS